MIAAGEPAPEFLLRNQDGEEVSLGDYRGRKVLLVFYPLDFSPVCSDQLSILIGPMTYERGAQRARSKISTSWSWVVLVSVSIRRALGRPPLEG